MNARWRNIFLAIGIIGVGAMLCTLPVGIDQLWRDVRRAGAVLPLVIALWGCIYAMNALAWHRIIGSTGQDCPIGSTGQDRPIGYWRTYKLTITSFALNNVTPVGLMGSEPYRLMELSPLLGKARAASSVVLYTMTHIFSHFLFWLMSIVLFLSLRPVPLSLAIPLAALAAVCLWASVLFMRGYRHGLAQRTFRLLGKMPWIGHWATRFATDKAAGLTQVDSLIASLHGRRRTTFYAALALELAARLAGCVEVWLLLGSMTDCISYLDAVLIVAFSSLFANILFFAPLQLGTREGGFALSTAGLAIPAALGVYTSLLTRLREVFWIVAGMILMKMGNKK